ncbi:Glycopeptide antibiotics resistance protein [Microlunatus sagamiharensis]|uniref:Glycopeptide antibiotics resistance protein n=1 Tax=Microlunatus sagamiharensis TaxID=546874 RepID=A0A1H2MC16_9ACTN|nr:VanZ family protein [Microlunatus sagamiharensis]SDU90763.1 Glycopeptide antibiotics resistance protein [Microlunatus sagamiharensis]
MPEVFAVTVQAGPVLVPVLVGVVVVWLLALGHREALTGARALTVLVTSAYGAAVLAVTFFPMTLVLGRGAAHPGWLASVNVVPGAGLDVRNLVLNVVMTLPLGLLVPFVLRARSVAGVATVGLVVSGAIETAQWVGTVLLGMTRTADVDDLVANVTGAALGAALLSVVASLAGPALERFALPGSGLAGPGSAQTGWGWLVDDPEDTDDTGATAAVLGAGASTPTTAAARSAVPKIRSPKAAYGSR